MKLDSIRIQKSGPQLLVSDETLRRELGITAEQPQSLQGLTLEQSTRSLGWSAEQKQEYQPRFEAQLLGVLTPQQLAAWNQKAGPPIDFEGILNGVPSGSRRGGGGGDFPIGQ